MKIRVNPRLRFEVSDIAKRSIGVGKVATVVIRSTVKLLYPSFRHSQLFQRGVRLEPFTLANASGKQHIAFVRLCLVRRVVLGYQRNRQPRDQLISDTFYL